VDEVLISVDPHEASSTLAVFDPTTRTVIDGARFANTKDGYRDLMRFAARWRKRRWAVEGCHGAAIPWPSGSWPSANGWSTCPPSWRLERGCSPRATARRPTATTPCRSDSPPWTPTGSRRSSPTTPGHTAAAVRPA
jgi:hypothetical protein